VGTALDPDCYAALCQSMEEVSTLGRLS